jgi:endoribonuclease LACTB2
MSALKEGGLSSSNSSALPLRAAVSIIFTFKDEVFAIRRQNYLRAFPGYHAFPGGKVDADDLEEKLEISSLQEFPAKLIHALGREIDEELGVDFFDLFSSGKVSDFWEFGVAVTPPFHSHRFETHFYQCNLTEKIDFIADKSEAAEAGWIKASELLNRYNSGEILAVPPTIIIFERLAESTNKGEFFNFNLLYDPDSEVPMIETIKGVKQFLPFSNTFPPAYRTNCFLIGDDGQKKILIDPSPKDREEYKKLLKSISKFEVNEVFLTHHHPDHHEYSTDLARELMLPMSMSRKTHQLLLEDCGEDYFKGLDLIFYKESFVVTRWMGEEVRVFEVPGHASGQLALAPIGMGWFLAGDLIQTIGSVVIGGSQGNMRHYFKSMEKVIGLNPRFVLPSHGIPMGGVHQVVKTLKHRKERERTISELLLEGKTKEEMLKIIYPELAPELEKYAAATILAHLDKLAEES